LMVCQGLQGLTATLGCKRLVVQYKVRGGVTMNDYSYLQGWEKANVFYDNTPNFWDIAWDTVWDFAGTAGSELWGAATSETGLSTIASGIGSYMNNEAMKDKNSDYNAIMRERMQLDRELAMANIASQEGMVRARIKADERRRREHNEAVNKPYVSKMPSRAKPAGILG